MNTLTTSNDASFSAPLAKATLAIAGSSLVGIAIVEGWQVFARYVLNNSPSWTEPVALLLMSTTMMCGAAIGVRGNRHFGFFLLGEKASPRLRYYLSVFAQLIAAAVGIIFVIAGGYLVRKAWDFPMAGAPLPQGAVYLPMCLGGALTAIFAAERIVMNHRRAHEL